MIKLENTTADVLFERLMDADSESMPIYYDALVRSVAPQTLLASALDYYAKHGRERALSLAVSLLSDLGPRAWPALQMLAERRHSECELFVPLMASCLEVPADQRANVLAELADHPDVDVRWAVVGCLDKLDASSAARVARQFTADREDDIRREAEEYLQVN